jgi:putative cell wall-binding protein
MLRRRAVLAVAALVAAVVGVGPVLAPVDATAGFTAERLAGADRYATAARVATATFARADAAIVASGENFPDALAGNYLAGRRQAPILLARRDGVPTATLDALRQLGVTRVTLLGGDGALGPAVAAALSVAGMTVDRIAGRDRIETAAAVARAGGAPPSHTAFLASGRTFADALAAGPVAYGSGIPQLLTEPGALPASVTAVLAELGITTVIVLGGTGAVSSGVEDRLRAAGLAVGRLSGGDRYETSTAIADWAIGALGHRRDHVDLATGAGFPDALAGAVHTGAQRGVVLLVAPGSTTSAAGDWLLANTGSVAGAHVFGGVQAIAESVLDTLVDAARGIVEVPVLCETTLLILVNTDRVLRGLAPYASLPAAAAIAESWSAHLAATQGLSHNGALGDQLDAAGIPWRGWGENVAYSYSAVDVHSLLMNSPVHLANVLDPGFTHIGIGCALDGNGTVWVTQDFVRL